MEEVIKDKAWLNSKWWYRTLKVIYISSFVLSVIVVFAAAWDGRPQESYYPSSEKSTITCTNGKIYTFSGINQLGKIYTDYEVNRINYICQNGEFPGTVPNISNPGKFFIVDYVYDINGSWKAALFTWLASGLSVLLFFWLVKGIFCYIATGKWNPANNVRLNKTNE